MPDIGGGGDLRLRASSVYIDTRHDGNEEVLRALCDERDVYVMSFMLRVFRVYRAARHDMTMRKFLELLRTKEKHPGLFEKFILRLKRKDSNSSVFENLFQDERKTRAI